MKSVRSLFGGKSLKLSSGWLFLILGILGYVIAYLVWWEENNQIKDIILDVSNMCVVGAVVTYLTTVADSMGIFKSTLEEVVTNTVYLEKRKDISTIWKNASKVILEKKFPDISDELLSLIETHYISKQEYSYYNDYHITTDIKWADEQKKYIEVSDVIVFDLITEKKGNVKIPFSAWIRNSLANDHKTICDLTCFVNGVEVKTRCIEKPIDSNGGLLKTHVLKIHNKDTRNKYRVMLRRKRVYDFDLDYDISFRAKYIVKDMTVRLNLPDDINASFICRGTTQDFIRVTDTNNAKEYIYKGLLLQRQGYTFALQRN